MIPAELIAKLEDYYSNTGEIDTADIEILMDYLEAAPNRNLTISNDLLLRMLEQIQADS